MKKLINKNTIFTFILGLLISGVTVYAVTYEAKDINYKTNVSVKDALDDLYDKTCVNWIEIDNATEKNASYVYNNRANLYKCGNVCRISFAFDGVSLNTNYKFLKNEKYYPSSDVSGSGIGASDGYMNFKLTTSGNIVIESQSRSNTGWASSTLTYICNN